MHRLAAFALVLVACADTGDVAAPSTREPEAVVAATPVVLPTSADAMKTWLHEGTYKAWKRESAPHASTGPHAASVLTYVNDSLDASLASGAAEHPAGAATVKEFLGADGVTGWAVAVKTKATSESGQGWYWYETFSREPGRHGIEGQGARICVNCHTGGSDFVLTPYPLR